MNQPMRTIALTSGKGGTGKTCVAANLGIALAAQGHRVVVFDADLQLANLDVALGIKAPYGLQHVVNEERSLRDILCPGPGNIRVVTGGSAIPALMSAGPKRMGTFLRQIEDLAHDTDFLLFDTGAGLDSRVFTFVGFAQQAILVTTPDPTSVTDAYATVKVATRRAPATEFGLLVNMVSEMKDANGVHAALARVCESYLGVTLPLLGYLHADDEVAAATRKRQCFVLTAPRSRAAREMNALAISLANGQFQPMLRMA